jgi:hypothetical protein
MPRPPLAMLLVLAAAPIEPALAGQPEPTATVVYGSREGFEAPAFEPRGRVRTAAIGDAEPETAAVTVVRGIRSDDPLPATDAAARELDLGLIHMLADLCRIDLRYRDAVALGLPGDTPIDARF